jgi:hypothetical protein
MMVSFTDMVPLDPGTPGFYHATQVYIKFAHARRSDRGFRGPRPFDSETRLGVLTTEDTEGHRDFIETLYIPNKSSVSSVVNIFRFIRELNGPLRDMSMPDRPTFGVYLKRHEVF